MSTMMKVNGVDIDYGALSGHAGTLTVVAVELWDGLTGGSFYFSAPLSVPRPITSGDSLNFPAGSLIFTLAGINGAVVANSVAGSLLDVVLGGAFGPVTYYAALVTVQSNAAGTGKTEFSGAGTYARIALTNNLTNFPVATLI